ncbi:MAG: hypothetical protein KGJ34_00955 [Patescibacteria group bacterium]|nr:hypothetical protein [Patescibacteria group bacterium]
MADETTPGTSGDSNKKDSLDLEKILLPKKDPSKLSAQRVNAAEVLEAASAPLPKAPAPEPLPVKPALEIPAIETYKSDIEETVRGKNISLVEIAAAQARRGGSLGPAEEEVPQGTSRKRLLQIGVGGLLLLGAVVAIAAALSRGSALPPAQSPSAPYIYVDGTQTVPVPEGSTRSEIMTELEADRQNTNIALGLISRLYLVAPATTTNAGAVPLSTSDFFSLMAPNADPSLVRSLDPTFLLGVHSFDGNQAFLIFTTNSYDQAYAGMLSWEDTMQTDLSPLFDRTPPIHIPEEGNTAAEAIAAPQLLQSPFSDLVVDNEDARVIQDSSGDILLLWTFVDRQTLVITTNQYTLQEIISRLTEAPVVPIPGE